MKLLNTKAFTIAEVLIAASLVIIISIALFFVFTTAITSLRYIMELRTATLVLQEQASKIRDLEFSDVQSAGGTFTSPEMSSLNNATGTIVRSLYDGHDKIIKVTFKIDWTAYNGNPAHKTLFTLITDHGINKR